MYLYLDTTERDSFRVVLIRDGRVLKDKTVFSVRAHSEKLLRTINRLFKLRGANSPSFTKEGGRGWLRGIAVVKGPGSFTSLRVGISTANALAYAWGVPVAGVKPGYDLRRVEFLFKKKKKRFNIALPEYGREPHITSRKL